ncbi:hypothetical protein DNAM_210 [Pseudomonas phage BroderSalsa]|nr:hypothetical protein DNAM_210 [Pseudomonas phage BroderSalsa]
MMDLFNNLYNRGSSAPTDMSQVRVPQQAMDLSGVTGAANSQINYDPNAGSNGSWDGAMKGLMYGGASAIAGMNQGGNKQVMQGSDAAAFRGASLPDQMNAEKLSGARLASGQQFAKVGGLMRGSSS